MISSYEEWETQSNDAIEDEEAEFVSDNPECQVKSYFSKLQEIHYLNFFIKKITFRRFQYS